MCYHPSILWCAECHEESKTGNCLIRTTELEMACEACKKLFRRSVGEFEDSDEYCPHVCLFCSSFSCTIIIINQNLHFFFASVSMGFWVFEPQCDNHHGIIAEKPRATIGVESEYDRVDGRGAAHCDERAVEVERKQTEELAKLWEDESPKIDF